MRLPHMNISEALNNLGFLVLAKIQHKSGRSRNQNGHRLTSVKSQTFEAFSFDFNL